MKKTIQLHGLRVCVNALPARGEGGRDYAKIIVKYFSRTHKDWKFLVTLTQNQYEEFFFPAGNVEWRVVNPRYQSGLSRLFWEQVLFPRMLRKWKAGVAYTLGSLDIFLAPCPTAIKIGNMLPYDQFALSHQTSGRGRLFLLRVLGKLSSKTADAVVVMSGSAKDYLVRHHAFDPARSHGIVHSADLEEFHGLDSAQEVVAKVGAGFILTVSHIYRYKNFLELLQGYREALDQGVDLAPLVIAGGDMDQEYAQTLRDYARSNGLEKKVLFAGNMPRPGLGSLYRACRFFVYISLVETCPRTLIEAMKCGTAILCTDRSVMPEIGGAAPLYFDPCDVDDIKHKLIMLQSDDGLIDDLEQRSLREARRFDWGITARKTAEVLAGIARRAPE